MDADPLLDALATCFFSSSELAASEQVQTAHGRSEALRTLVRAAKRGRGRMGRHPSVHYRMTDHGVEFTPPGDWPDQPRFVRFATVAARALPPPPSPQADMFAENDENP